MQQGGVFFPLAPVLPMQPHGPKVKKRIPSYRKSMWSQAEDQMLQNAVSRYGTNNWGSVAVEIQGRSGKQCRERWAGILNPGLRREPWTREEDDLLKALHAEHGNRWSLIALQMKGRSTIALRNRWSWHARQAQNACRIISERNAVLGENGLQVPGSMMPPGIFSRVAAMPGSMFAPTQHSDVIRNQGIWPESVIHRIGQSKQ
jgi:hypothetical protein